MFDLLLPVTEPIRRSGLVRPVAVAATGALGINFARHNAPNALVVVFGALAVVMTAIVLRERGLAAAALGVAAAAAWTTPAGLGPYLVTVGVVIAGCPSLVDARLGQWPGTGDALIGLPAFAGLASVAAGQPSLRGVLVAAVAATFIVATWWRGPRHHARVPRATVASYLASVAAVAVALAPNQLGRFAEVPPSTVTASRGVAAGLAVFLLVWLIQELRRAPRP